MADLIDREKLKEAMCESCAEFDDCTMTWPCPMKEICLAMHTVDAQPTVVDERPTAVDERYRWHDLSKDQKDLPEDARRVLVCYEHKTFGARAVGVAWRMKTGVNGRYRWSSEDDCDVSNWQVVAWKHIEPFEEEEE